MKRSVLLLLALAAASAPSGHTFAFGGATGILPEHRNDFGTWTANVMQNVTWWKDEDAPTVVVLR